MSSITTFRGKQGTKARRNSTIPACSSIASSSSRATSLTSSATSSLSASTTTECSTLSKAAATYSSALAPNTLTISMESLQPSPAAATSSIGPSTSLNTATLQTSSTTTSSTLVSPTFTSQAPAPVASPDTPAASPQTPPPDPSSGDQPGGDPAPSVQSSTPSAQTTSPAVSVAPSIAVSVDPQQSQQPISTGAPDPAASDSFLLTATSSGTATSSIVQPLAIPAASSGSSLIPIPGSTPSETIGNPNAPAHTNGPTPMRKAVVAGAAAGGVLGGVFLLAIVFLLFRKFRRRRLRFGRHTLGSPLLDRHSGPRSSSGLVGKFGRLMAMLDVKNFTTRRPPNVYEDPSPTSIFSNMASRSNSPPAISPRRRSWSAPAPAFQEILQTAIPTTRKPAQSAAAGKSSLTTFQDSSQLPSLFGRTNRSVSSISHAVYSPEPDSENNPFRDPDPSAPLRIVNPDPSRQGTPVPTNKILLPPELQSKPPWAMQSLSHNSAQPRAQNPFSDPTNEAKPSNPLLLASASSLPKGVEASPPKTAEPERPRTVAPSPPKAVERSRSKTVDPKTVEPKTVEPKTAEPKTVEPKTVEPKTVEPKTVEPSPHRRSASVSSTYSEQSSVGPLPQMAALQAQQQSRLSQPSTTSADSGFVSADPSPISPEELSEPPAHNYQSTTLRPSPPTAYPSTTRSSWTSDMNSLGEPGPTRPNTSIFGSTSRISDPFDLDRPEVLGFASPAKSIVGRSNSNRSDK